MAERLLIVSSSPHLRSGTSVRGIMRDVLIGLFPAAAAAIWNFGVEALLVMAVSVLSCVASEAIWQKATHRRVMIGDMSAVVTGLLLSFTLPPSVPLWLPVVGGLFAIIVVKEFYGGLGQNIVNPALAARTFLLLSWPVQMTHWTVDGVSAATALKVLKEGSAVAGAGMPGIMNAFMGHVAGCLGETSALAILIGGAYLLYRRVISWHIPIVYCATVSLLMLVLGRNGLMSGQPLYELLSGGLLLGAFFMATDYTTSPMTREGKMLFAFGCGLVTSLIRLYGGYDEGVAYSILIMNLFVPLIDRYVRPRRFGEVK